jgi:hypothetical protein
MTDFHPVSTDLPASCRRRKQEVQQRNRYDRFKQRDRGSD